MVFLDSISILYSFFQEAPHSHWYNKFLASYFVSCDMLQVETHPLFQYFHAPANKLSADCCMKDKSFFASLREKRSFAYAKTKAQISCAVTAQLISTFVFATQQVQSLFFFSTKFQGSSLILWLYRPVCISLAGNTRIMMK